MSMSLKKYSSSITKNQETSGDDKFMKPPPDKTIGIKNGQYDKMNEKGYIPEETPITNGDVIFGKVTPINDTTNSGKIFKDSSEQYKSHADGVVDRVYTGIKNQDGYETRKALIRSERFPHIGDKMCCFDPQHDILTTGGWIPVGKITKNHKVATLINGNILMYTNPLDIQEYDYEGDMYNVESNMIKLNVTPNHRMWTKMRNSKEFKIEKAEDILNKPRKYKKNVEKYIPLNLTSNNINNMRKFVLPSINELNELELEMKPFLTLLGIWIAEGWISIRDWALGFAAHKQRVKDALVECCNILGFKIHKHLDKGFRNKWNVPDKRLVSILKPMNGAINKYLPEFVWDLEMQEARWLIDGMMLGDGHTMKNGTRRYDTSSKRLADDFQRLCLHAGYSTNIIVKYKAGHESICVNNERKGEVIKSTVDAYRLTIIETQNNPLVNKTKKMDNMISYKGKVHCCTVIGDGVLYVRYKGYPVWCGNSRHGQNQITRNRKQWIRKNPQEPQVLENEKTFSCVTS